MKDSVLLAALKHMAARLMAGPWPELPPECPDPPEDPFAGVREPKHRRPGGRSSAVALREPESDQAV
jgi:hypothetical protein